MATSLGLKQLLIFARFGVAALFTFIVAIAALFVNAITSSPAMVLGTIVSDESLLSIPLTVLGGAVPGMVTAFLIYLVFTATRFKSFKLSLFAILPIILFWVSFVLFFSSLAVGKWIAIFDIFSQTVALFFIYRKTLGPASKVSKADL